MHLNKDCVVVYVSSIFDTLNFFKKWIKQLYLSYFKNAISFKNLRPDHTSFNYNPFKIYVKCNIYKS